MEKNPKKGLGIAIGIIAVIGIFFVSVAAMKKDSPVSQPVATETAPSNPPAGEPVPVTVPKKTPASSVYKNGTYSATGSYMSPGGPDQLGVSVTLQDDIITAATVTSMAGDRTSTRYQNMFISGYKQQVIGQNIASVNLTYVSGSSLTPKGFDDALQQIETQAKA